MGPSATKTAERVTAPEVRDPEAASSNIEIFNPIFHSAMIPNSERRLAVHSEGLRPKALA